MFDDSRAFAPDDFDAFSELEDGELEEWDSLKDLLSDLDDREREPVVPGAFEIPALLGDGDGITRWIVRLSQIRRLSSIAHLRQGMPRAPWCIAMRVIAIDHDAVRIGVTTTRHVSREQLAAFVATVLNGVGDLTVAIEPVVRQAAGERWLTIDEVSREFRARTRDIERWIEAGLLVARQVETAHGSEWRVRLRPSAVPQAVGAFA